MPERRNEEKGKKEAKEEKKRKTTKTQEQRGVTRIPAMKSSNTISQKSITGNGMMRVPGGGEGAGSSTNIASSS